MGTTQLGAAYPFNCPARLIVGGTEAVSRGMSGVYDLHQDTEYLNRPVWRRGPLPGSGGSVYYSTIQLAQSEQVANQLGVGTQIIGWGFPGDAWYVLNNPYNNDGLAGEWDDAACDSALLPWQSKAWKLRQQSAAIFFTASTAQFDILAEASQPPEIIPSQSLSFKVGENSTKLVRLLDPNGFSESFSATGLPSGLSIRSATGEIYGAPVSAGNYTCQVTAQNFYGTSSKQVGIAVEKATASINIRSDYYYTGDPITAVVSVVPEWAAYTVTYNGSAQKPINAGTYTVVVTVDDLDYTGTKTQTIVVVDARPIITAGQSVIAVPASVGGPFSKTFQLTDSANRPVTSWSATGLPSWATINPTTGEITGLPPSQGAITVISLTATGPGGTDTETATIRHVETPIISAGQTFAGKVGGPFSQTPTLEDPVNGYSILWQGWNQTTPPGLSINDSTGVITGTPTSAGSFTFTVRVNGPNQGLYSDGTIVINIAVGEPVITPGQNSLGAIGEAFSKTFSLTDPANRPATSWEAMGLPSWATINSTTGEITGYPSTNGSTTIALKATGPGGASTVTSATIDVGVGIPIIVSGQSFSGELGKPFNITPIIENALYRPVTSWSATGLPPGLSLNTTTGAVTGTPTVDGSFTAKFIAVGPAGSSADRLL